MKKNYRNRFILGAMMAFTILMVLVIGSVYAVSYVEMEQESSRFVAIRLSEEKQSNRLSFSQPFSWFLSFKGNKQRIYANFYDIRTDAQGVITSMEKRGMLEESDDSVQQLVHQVLQTGKAAGKSGIYKFGVKTLEDGAFHVILMDGTVQLRTLNNVLRTSALVGIVMLALLFIILLPVGNRVADSAVRGAEKQKQFITDAGHDLKTPVAIMRTNLDMLELLDGKSKWSHNIRSQVDRLEGLIKQLLMLSRLDEKQVSGEMECVDLQHMIQSEIEAYQEDLDQKNLHLTTELEENLVLRGDGDTLKQLMRLLMDNAVQYTPHDGSIAIEARREKKKICWRVLNTVDELPPMEPEKLLDRFTRGSTARTQTSGGSGIGLSAAKTIVELHKGSIHISYPDEKHFQVDMAFPHKAQ